MKKKISIDDLFSLKPPAPNYSEKNINRFKEWCDKDLGELKSLYYSSVLDENKKLVLKEIIDLKED